MKTSGAVESVTDGAHTSADGRARNPQTGTETVTETAVGDKLSG